MSPTEVNAAIVGAARAAAQAAFQQADTDNNGQLSRAEFDKAIIEPANVVFQILDLNHDGQISQQEAQPPERVVVEPGPACSSVPEPANSPTQPDRVGQAARRGRPGPDLRAPRPAGGRTARASPAPRPPQPR